MAIKGKGNETIISVMKIIWHDCS